MTTDAAQRGPILLTGVSGQVGSYARSPLNEFGRVVAPDRGMLDLRDEGSIRRFINETRPRWIINPAAYTDVDGAERDPDTAFAVNAEAPRILGEAAATLGIPIIHFSTDYVFSGEGDTPWREDDAAAPLNMYGASKLAGERALANSGAPYVIFRTSWVYSATGKNFVRTILRLAGERDEVRVVDDQTGSPTSAASLAGVVAHVVRRCEATAAREGLSLGQSLNPFAGTYHVADRGYTTWYGFASGILELVRASGKYPKLAKLTPIPATEFPTLAKRPANSRLDTTKLENDWDYRMRPWHAALTDVISGV